MKYILILLFTLYLPTIEAQGITSLLTQNNNSEKEKVEITLPKVESMGPKWFSFLEIEDKKVFKTKTNEFKNYLRKVYKGLPDKVKVEVYPHLEKIVYGINFYYNFKFSINKESDDSFVLSKNEYAIEDFFNFLNLYHLKELESKEIEFELNELKGKFEEDKDEYENILANYLKMGEIGPQKIILGYQVISTKVKTLIDEIKTKERRNKFLGLQKELQKLEPEIKKAKTKIVVSRDDQTWIKKELKEAVNNLKNFRKKIKDFNINAPGKFYFGDREVTTTIHEKYFELVFTNRNILNNIFDLKSGVSKEQLNQMTDELEKNQKLIEEISSDLKIWDQKLKSLIRNIEVKESSLNKIPDTIAKIQEINRELFIGKLLIDLYKNLLYSTENALKSKIFIIAEKISEFFYGITKIFNYSIFTIGETPVTFLGLVNVIVIIFLSLLLSKGIRFSLQRISERRIELNPSSLYILGRLSHYVVMSVGLVVGLSSIGLDFSNVALVAGALTVGIGFGLQSIFNNFVSGLILLFERPLKVGDYIELESGVRGEVREINVRSTRITTRDNIDNLVPNSELINGKVVNWTLYDYVRRVHVPFGVAYGTDKDLLKKAALEAAMEVPYTIKHDDKRKPDLWLTSFGDSSLNFELIVWVNGKLVKKDRVEVDYLWELETKLREYNIEIPFPQRDLHIKTVSPDRTKFNVKLDN